jgi:hypothetical protein
MSSSGAPATWRWRVLNVLVHAHTRYRTVSCFLRCVPPLAGHRVEPHAGHATPDPYTRGGSAAGVSAAAIASAFACATDAGGSPLPGSCTPGAASSGRVSSRTLFFAALPAMRRYLLPARPCVTSSAR